MKGRRFLSLEACMSEDMDVSEDKADRSGVPALEGWVEHAAAPATGWHIEASRGVTFDRVGLVDCTSG
jgi:hypothetical protein